jgi:hypothetical protein
MVLGCKKSLKNWQKTSDATRAKVELSPSDSSKHATDLLQIRENQQYKPEADPKKKRSGQPVIRENRKGLDE